ncbi:MAG: O-antigen ligase family protein [Stellaceae bacterium]
MRRTGGSFEPTVDAGGAAALDAPLTARRLAIGFEAGLDASALLFFPLLVLVPRGIAPLASVAGLFAAGLVLSIGRPVRCRGVVAPAGLAAALLVWGCVSALWSIDPWRSLEMTARLAGLFAAGLAMAVAAGSVSAPRRLSAFLLGGFILGIAMAAIDLASHGALSKPFSDRFYQPSWLNQASVAFAILLLPASAALAARGRKIAAMLFALAAGATICALSGTAAKVALAAGLPMALFCWRWRVGAPRLAALAAILVIITAPLTFARLERGADLVETADAVKLSAGHRLLIWSFVGDRIAEHPLAGWGLDSSRAIPGGKDPIQPGETWLPLHPHNAALQLWLELGVPGAVLFALLIGGLWRALAAAKWPRLFAAAAGGSLATGFVATFATYGIWEEWWQGTLWFSLFVVLVMARVAAGAADRT